MNYYHPDISNLKLELLNLTNWITAYPPGRIPYSIKYLLNYYNFEYLQIIGLSPWLPIRHTRR